MKPARKLKYGTAILALGMLAVFPPGVTEATPVDPAIMAKVGPKKANPGQNKKQLIERGRELFMNETFNGNGRTCATCHPPTNNFTIDPEFIATLPNTDPLFVAERNPALATLENPALMRQFGLILENLDGLPPQHPVFRGVPHTLALPTSIKVDPAGADSQTREDDSTVVEATGWSGDGAPGDGSLRSFAIGAVIQHFPKTLNRIEGQDFRLPTPAELDAMEAFQLSLGRQTDLNLSAMHFLDDDVDTGKDLFKDGVDGEGGAAPTCAGCHRNAGATDFTGFNGNVQTNVARLMTPAREFARASGDDLLDLPGDGGFDAAPEVTESVDGLDVTYRGNRTMNVPPLVEAADTAPFFHNNAVDTIEEAITFYTTATFSTDPTRQFVFSDAQINQIGAFLRTINALENIRSSNAYSAQAQREVQKLARQTVKVVVAETEDALQVLTEGAGPNQDLLPLYPGAVALLEEALDLEIEADQTTPPPHRNALLRQAAALKNEARDLILE
jgi:cytochrome c peroxidase